MEHLAQYLSGLATKGYFSHGDPLSFFMAVTKERSYCMSKLLRNMAIGNRLEYYSELVDVFFGPRSQPPKTRSKQNCRISLQPQI